MIFCGVDPGLQGGIAVIYPDKVRVIPMPLAGKEIDVMGIIDFVPGFIPRLDVAVGDVIAYIESVHSMPKQGVSSCFKFGFVTGIVHGVLRTVQIPIELVTPQAWKKEILAGTDKSKEAAIDWCRRVYPQVNLIPDGHRVPHSGMGDALCIAEYGRRKYK